MFVPICVNVAWGLILCPICGFNMEIVLHALIACLVAVVSWFACPLRLRCERMSSSSFVDWFLSLKSILDLDQLGIVAMVAWCIWNERNNVLYGNKRIHPAIKVARCMFFFFFEDFKAAHALLNGQVDVVQHAAR